MKNLFFVAALAMFIQIASAQSREQLFGCWSMASKKGEGFQLNRDGSFTFNDWNAKKGDWDVLYGTWKLETASKLTLYYDDRTKQSFSLKKNAGGKWAITKVGGFLFMKSDSQGCIIPADQ